MTDNNTEFAHRLLVDGANKERYSIEYVSGITSQEDALTFIDGVASDVASDNKVIAKRTGQATIRLALATYTAITQSVISEDQSAAGVVMTKTKYAEKFGRTSSLVSRWIALGFALMRCQIDPTGQTKYVMPGETGESAFDLWKCLSSYGGADAVSADLKAGKPADEIIAALKAAGFGPNGRKVRTAAAAPRLKASSSKSDGTAVVTDEKGAEVTLDVSKNAVRLALELAEVWNRAKDKGADEGGINRHDMSVIRQTLAPLMVEDPAQALADKADEAQTA